MKGVGVFCLIPFFPQWGGNATYYNLNGSYGGAAQTSQFGNMANTTYYNANGSYGGSSRTTTFGNQTTTHLEVTVAVLGGYGGDDFREFFAVTSGGEREAGKGGGKQGVGRRHLDFPIFAKSGKHE